MALIIDIETTSWFKDKEHKRLILEENQHKGLKDPEKIAENHKKIINNAALSPYTGMVTVAGLRDTGKEESVMLTNDYSDLIDPFIIPCKDEAVLLSKVWDYINDSIGEGIRIVGFNSKSFDLPYLFVRSVINEVIPKVSYLDLIHPYNHDLHLDVKSLFDKGSLKEIAYVLNAQTNNKTEGSELPQLWFTDPGKVVEKCKSDLIQTEKIYNMIKYWIPQRLQIL